MKACPRFAVIIIMHQDGDCFCEIHVQAGEHSPVDDARAALHLYLRHKKVGMCTVFQACIEPRGMCCACLYACMHMHMRCVCAMQARCLMRNVAALGAARVRGSLEEILE